jgi:hypothetical protein
VPELVAVTLASTLVAHLAVDPVDLDRLPGTGEADPFLRLGQRMHQPSAGLCPSAGLGVVPGDLKTWAGSAGRALVSVTS